MGFLDFAALLKGMSDEATVIRKERQQQENEQFEKTMKYIDYELQMANIRPEYRDQLLQAKHEIVMENLGYGKKSKSGSPIRKAIESMVGQQPGDYAGKVSQIGVGSGNAKTKVGGIQGGPPALPSQTSIGDVLPFNQPPQPPMGQAPPQAGPQGPPPAPPPQVAMNAGMPPPPPQVSGRFYSPEEVAYQGMVAEAQKKNFSIQQTLQMLRNDPVWNTLTPQEQANAVYKLYTGSSIEGTTNPQAAETPMTVAELKAVAPEVAAGLPPGMKDDALVTPYLNKALKVIGALPYHSEAKASSNNKTPDIENYEYYKQGEEAAGKKPMSFPDWQKWKANLDERSISPNVYALGQLRNMDIEDREAVSPGQIINKATRRPINVTGQEALQVANSLSLIQQSSRVEEILAKLEATGKTGAIAGWAMKEGVYVPIFQDTLTPDQYRAVSEVSRLLNTYVYALSGKAISEPEADRVSKTVPSLTYSASGNRAIVEEMKRYSKEALDNYLTVQGWDIAGGIGATGQIGTGAGGSGGTDAGKPTIKLTRDPKTGRLVPAK